MPFNIYQLIDFDLNFLPVKKKKNYKGCFNEVNIELNEVNMSVRLAINKTKNSFIFTSDVGQSCINFMYLKVTRTKKLKVIKNDKVLKLWSRDQEPTVKAP